MLGEREGLANMCELVVLLSAKTFDQMKRNQFAEKTLFLL